MTREQQIKKLSEIMAEKAKNKPSGTYEEMVTFQLAAMASMLTDIAKSLAVIADKVEREDKNE